MKTIIIEDEQLAAERLKLLLRQFDTSIQILAVLDSISASVKWLNLNPPPDFILADIHLADGSVFSLFNQVQVTTPVIFTTAFDRYALDAFKVMSIDYLLKPVSLQALSQAINKLKTLQRSTASPSINYTELSKQLQQINAPYKTRFVGKIGQKIFFIDANDVSSFVADNKIVTLRSKDGSKYLVEHTLEQLESLLNPATFFRLNRSTIINISVVELVKPYINNRLKVMLKNGSKSEEIIVSRERVADFRKWADS
jgi:DNA-binding LytR/AlgR family response regulator